MSARRKRGRSVSRGAGADEDVQAKWRAPEGLAIALAALLVVFAAHLAFGAIRLEAALTAVALTGALLLACLAAPSLRRDLLAVRALAWPAAFFVLTLAAGLLSLTPYAVGGPHPTWAYLGQGPGSASVDPSATILELIKLMGLGCIFLVGAATGASDERARTAVKLFVLLATLFGLFAFFGFVTDALFQTQHRRLEGTLLSPNTAGTFFATALVVTLGPLMRNLRTAPNRPLEVGAPYWIALLVLAACLLMTASRGAALGAAAGVLGLVLLLFFAGRASWTRTSLIMMGALVAGFAAVYLFGENLIDRWARWEADAGSRGEMFAMHWRAFLSAPWSGFGLGTFDIIHRTLLDAETLPSMWSVRATHNVYIQWLEEAGLVGATPMFACLAAIIGISLVRGARRSRMTYVLFALIAANLVVLVHGVTDFALQTPSVALMWSYLLGLQFALSQGSSR